MHPDSHHLAAGEFDAIFDKPADFPPSPKAATAGAGLKIIYVSGIDDKGAATFDRVLA